ncbi:MAG: hypothetical protein EBZ49_00465 [Proteobacteria bacterium]|nr:hypothetical protein [Pseudomonadota bacterium]
MATTSFSNWDFYNYHVQSDLIGGQFVSAESTLVAAGPPSVSQTSGGGTNGGVYPIGLLESVGLQQSKQLQRIFEIGSSRSYFIPGRVIGSLSIGRTFYFGPSLLRVLYAYYRSNANNIVFGQTPAGSTTVVDGLTVPDPNAVLLDVVDQASLHSLKRSPGEDYFFIELASDLFNQPTGMAIYFKDQNAVSVGALYLEFCYVQGHQMSISSGSVLVMEGVSMQYDRIVPIKVLV